MPEISETIRASASGPRRASGDVGSVEQHSLPDQIAADQYLAAKEAAGRPDLGIRFVPVRTAGAWEQT